MKKLLFSTFVIFLLSTYCFAQNNPANAVPKKKEHYRIINTNNESTLNCEKSFPRASFDSLRFMNERRHIPIDGTTMVLELFSAQELFNEFAKPISPFTIKDPAKARLVKIRINEKGYVEVIAK